MLIEYFNVYGLESRVKPNKVRDLIVSNFLDFLSVRAIKLNEVSDSHVHALYVNPFCKRSFSPSMGNIGGMNFILYSSNRVM